MNDGLAPLARPIHVSEERSVDPAIEQRSPKMAESLETA
jgi:hypothetical protein